MPFRTASLLGSARIVDDVCIDGMFFVATEVDQLDVLEGHIDMVESWIQTITTYFLVKCPTPVLAPENIGTFPLQGAKPLMHFLNAANSYRKIEWPEQMDTNQILSSLK